jgi:pSer/pThr/pTyr-binding forkhead associated (FHA) protein
MPTCARGHQSQSVDYCDECGAPIGGVPPASGAVSAASGAVLAASSADAGSSPSAGTPTTTPDEGTGPTPCPDCGTPASGRFCESCGFDLLMARLAPDVVAPAPDSTEGDALPRNVPPNGSAAPSSESVPASTAPAPWRLVVSADAAYYARMQDEAEPDAEPISFPAFCPERRFALDGDQILIGRRSRSRGIEPQIDLSGPPEDPAVSHAHALLVPQAAGGWAVVDLDSANGTYLNDGSDPIRANEPAPLADGDRVHLGAWTTLTLRRT